MMTMPLKKSFRKCEDFKDDAANDKAILPTYMRTYAHAFIPIVSFFSASIGTAFFSITKIVNLSSPECSIKLSSRHLCPFAN